MDPIKSIEASRTLYFHLLVASTVAVAIGVILEEANEFFDWMISSRRIVNRIPITVLARSREFKRWAKRISRIGWYILIAGVIGEGLFEVLVSRQDTKLQATNSARLEAAATELKRLAGVSGKALSDANAATKLAGLAKDSAGTAERASVKALAQAKEAESHLAESLRRATEAEAKSADAVSSASTALDLARGARKEADAFETRLGSAEHKADEAEKHLSDTLARATKAEQESARLTAKFADRTLSDLQVQNIGDALISFAGQEYEVTTYWETPECIAISNRIYAALQVAHWRYIPPANGSALLGGIAGIEIFRHPDADDPIKNAADSLASLLNANGVYAEVRLQSPKNNPKHNRITLIVGARR